MIFYLHLRHPPENEKEIRVMAIGHYTSGPFWYFKKEHIMPESHRLFLRDINSSTFATKRNLKVDTDQYQNADEIIKTYYDTEKDLFQFNNEPLKKVERMDELTLVAFDQEKPAPVPKKHAVLKIPSLPPGMVNHSLDNLNKIREIDSSPVGGKAKSETKNETGRTNGTPRPVSSLSSILKSYKQANRENAARDSQREQANNDSYLSYMNSLSVSSKRSRKSFLIQADELYCSSNCSKKLKQTSSQELSSFDVDDVYESVRTLEEEGLEVFNPINCHVSVYITKLEKLLAKHRLLGSAMDIIPHFLETVGNQYLNHIKHTKEQVDFDQFKSLFIQKFRSFKSLKINEALAFVYEGGCLLEFTRKKIEMVQYVFPKMDPADVIAICIGSFNNKDLIEAFSKSAHKDIGEFTAKVGLMRLKFPNLFQ